MMRSLFSGVAGLRTHQTRMDVIGNNIANVNTVAYKNQSATFQELMYQNTQSASGANNDTGRGGINMKQIGLGSSVAAINTNIALSGSSQSTGNALDVQIAGDAFFIVSDGSNNFFTRAGAFTIDNVGNLVMTSNGYTVMGWQPNPNDETQIVTDNVTPLQVMSEKFMTAAPEQTTEAYIGGIVDKNDTDINNDGRPVNISVYDALGYNYVIQCNLKAKNPPVDGEFTLQPIKEIHTGPSGKAESTDISGTFASLELKFNTSTGVLEQVGGATDLKMTLAAADLGNISDGFTQDINVDLSTLKMADNKGKATPEGHAGTIIGGKGAGRRIGSLTGIAIQQDGKIIGSYDNGKQRLLGQIAVTTFANAAGLEKIGDNLYQTTPNSGYFDGIGKDITADGSGSMKTGVLEMSNVDLSQEFTEMITTQRGFQANSRIITVSDSMLEELINLKR